MTRTLEWFQHTDVLKVDVVCSIPVEIQDRLMLVAERRDFTLGEALSLAITEFVEREFSNPTFSDADESISRPNLLKDLLPDEIPLNSSNMLRRFPRAADCPADKIEEWLDALHHDLELMTGKLKDLQPGVHADQRIFENVIEKYEVLIRDLMQRKRMMKNIEDDLEED